MLVVHGIWAYGALQVWAEDSALPAQAPPRAGRPSRAPRPHPFAAQPDAWPTPWPTRSPPPRPTRSRPRPHAAALAGAGTGDLPRKAVDDEVTLRLPSTADGPLASPELARPPADAAADLASARRPALAGWRVPVLVFEPAAAAALLPALAELPPGDLVASGSIGYLAAIARFADDLAARGRVLPVLVQEDGGYSARWRPVLSAADARYARELAAAMPAACRTAVANTVLANTGLASTGSGLVPGDAPGPLLADMLDAMADASVRARLPGALLPRAEVAAPPGSVSPNGCCLR